MNDDVLNLVSSVMKEHLEVKVQSTYHKIENVLKYLRLRDCCTDPVLHGGGDEVL